MPITSTCFTGPGPPSVPGRQATGNAWLVAPVIARFGLAPSGNGTETTPTFAPAEELIARNFAALVNS
jgi:hypothetical protein